MTEMCSGEIDPNNTNNWCDEKSVGICEPGHDPSEDEFPKIKKGSFVPAEDGLEARLKKVDGTSSSSRCVDRSCVGGPNYCPRGCTYECDS